MSEQPGSVTGKTLGELREHLEQALRLLEDLGEVLERGPGGPDSDPQ